MSSFISSYSFKRLIRDVKNINKNPLTDSGIYYSHDTDNILKGYALIVGPDDTPYEKSIFIFLNLIILLIILTLHQQLNLFLTLKISECTLIYIGQVKYAFLF